MQKYQKETLRWSNLFFLIPLTIALVYGVYWYVIVLLALFIVSFDFHFFKEAKEVYYIAKYIKYEYWRVIHIYACFLNQQ